MESEYGQAKHESASRIVQAESGNITKCISHKCKTLKEAEKLRTRPISMFGTFMNQVACILHVTLTISLKKMRVEKYHSSQSDAE